MSLIKSKGQKVSLSPVNAEKMSHISSLMGGLEENCLDNLQNSKCHVWRYWDFFKMRIGLFLVALDASEIPQSKQEVFIFTITMATVVLLQAECDEG